MPNRPTDRHFLRTSLPALIVVAAALLPAAARAAVEWHPDLESAHAAARVSRRPVLALFVAAPAAGESVPDTPCLNSPEAEALLASCFEPVRVDADAQPALARAAGVTRVPTACVLGDDDTPLAAFQAPATPSAFVSAALLAARRAADAGHGSTDAPGTAARGRAAAKVRELSAFAAEHGRPAAVATTTAFNSPEDADESEPRHALVAWADGATTPPAAAPQPQAIDPAAAPSTPPTVAPWLDSAAARLAQNPAPNPAPPAQPPAFGPPAHAVPPLTPNPALSAPAIPAPALPAPAVGSPVLAPAQPLPPPAAPATPAKTGAAAWIAAFQKPFAIFTKPAAKTPAQQQAPTSVAPAPPAVAAQPPAAAAATGEDVHGSMPLGLEGYCPVTLVDRGTWTEGRAQWGARHRGRTYLFAGPEEQRAFLANPDRYAPALSGDDPVLALDRGASTPGQRRYGVTYQARIYLFASPESMAAFSADPSRYATRIALAERTPPRAGATRTY